VERLLADFGFAEAASHRRQALEAHRGGHWGSTNAQARAFLLSLLRAIHAALGGVPGLDDKAVRDALAGLAPPFLRADVREWDPAGRNTFPHGLFARLAEDGPHPGLSDPSEAALRLRLADAVALDWLERLARRFGR
jgi:hypothetical protein